MNRAYFFVSKTLLLSILTIFTISCEKQDFEPESPAPTMEEQVITTTERLVGKWARNWYYTPSTDTLLFSEDGKCFFIIGKYPSGSSDTIAYYYDCSENFLVLYDGPSDYTPSPHHIEFYDDYNYFVMVNYPFEILDVIINVGFNRVE